MEVNSEDYFKSILLLNMKFETKLTDLTKYYSTLIDSSQVYNLMEIDSIENFISYCSEKVYRPLHEITKTIGDIEDITTAQTSNNNFENSLKPAELVKLASLPKSKIMFQRQDNINNSVFRITKLKKIKDKKGCLKYLYKRIRNSFNAYISFKINRILKLHNARLLPRSLKMVNQEQTRPFNTIFETSISEILVKIRSAHLSGLIKAVLDLKISKLQSTLSTPIKNLYTEYANSYQYKKDLKLIEAQVGTLNIKFLIADIQRHLALVKFNN